MKKIFLFLLVSTQVLASEPITEKCSLSDGSVIQFFSHKDEKMNTIKGNIGGKNISMDAYIEEDNSMINIYSMFGAFRMTINKKTGLGQLGMHNLLVDANPATSVYSVMCDKILSN